jgi:hypothetical protein
MEEEPPVLIEHRRCSLCPTLQDTAPRVALERAPWMNLQCGHQVHTNCFIEYIYFSTRNLLRFECPICHAHALENTMVEWMVQNDNLHFARPNTLDDLWNGNEEFRNDIRNLHKIQREESKYIQIHKNEVNQLKREWKEITYTSVQFLKDQKRIFKRSLYGLVGRRKGLRGINRMIAERRRLLNKYPNVSWSSFQGIRAVRGAPKLKIFSRTLGWKFMPYNLFRVRV